MKIETINFTIHGEEYTATCEQKTVRSMPYLTFRDKDYIIKGETSPEFWQEFKNSDKLKTQFVLEFISRKYNDKVKWLTNIL